MHKSIATIASPQFLNLEKTDLNPLMSKCEIKVLYLGKNRNGSYIDKSTATEMSKTLRGAPIVGYFRQDKEDFGDHGEQIVIENNEVHFNCLTVPYGFVSPDANVWFQEFDDYDEQGAIVTREYLMTTGYLWTGQFPECNVAVTEGRPHSMELDSETLTGTWTNDMNNNVEFFIINDATFSKLCILGDDVEPCFEGSSVTSPQASNMFKLDENFSKTLFSMMEDLKKLILEGGQQQMHLEDNAIVEEVSTEAPKEVETTFTEAETNEAIPSEENAVSEYAKADDEDKKKDESPASEEKEESESEDKEEKEDKKDDEEEEDVKKKYELLQSVYDLLQSEFNAVKAERDDLAAYKKRIEDEVENQRKDDLISSFTQLSDEEKQDVIENKANYSYDEIESKLSIIFARKEREKKNEESSSAVETNFTYNVDNNTTDSVPTYLKLAKQWEEMNK